MTEMVVALLMIIGGEINEARIQSSMYKIYGRVRNKY
jgi:hypothetical protein